MSRRVPTIHDLRTKLCYICREEETLSPDSLTPDQPKAWTHPCSCTLVAHEECLLRWIQTSQANPSRNAESSLKCPQCGTQYELESQDSAILRLLNLGNKSLQRVGRYVTVFGAASVVGIVGTTVYVCLTAYGAWAVEKFIGREMFQEILTDDPMNWPWSAYINLPLLPLSLVLSRFRSSAPGITVPLLLLWPPSLPLAVRDRRALERLSSKIPEGLPNPFQQGLLNTPPTPPRAWPPPPLIFGIFGLPLVKHFYRKLYGMAYEWLLETPYRPRRNNRRGNNNNGRNEDGNAANGGNDGLRFGEGPFVIRIRANMGEAGGDAPAAANLAPQQDDAAPREGPAGLVDAAEELIEVNAASLGRRVAGALLVPLIASQMGSLLFRLARYSRVLKAFLGIRTPLAASAGVRTGSAVGSLRGLLPFGAPDVDAGKTWQELNVVQRSRLGLRLLGNVMWGTTRTWLDSDPVWWRNCVGFGAFVVIKDIIQLVHLYLAKRELETRTVKNRDFRGVDISQLDLLPSFLSSSS